MNTGFYIECLLLTGTSVKPAKIEFKQGLNVISGASNTGKSFIYQCIDFMLGAKTVPKPLPESENYTLVSMVIQTYSGQTFTLKRRLIGGAFTIKQGSLDSQAEEKKYIELASPHNPVNISNFYLDICGLNDIKLKKNVQNQKVNLSFRDVVKLCIIDEKNILTEESPVFSGESTIKTKEKSLFNFFLTGVDASKFVEVEDPKIFKSKINGKIEFVKENLHRIQQKLDRFKNTNFEELKAEVSLQYETINLQYQSVISKIDTLKNQRSKYFISLERLNTKIIFKDELIERFKLLRDHYLSDLQRLEFIEEGNFLLKQLNNISCPLCGTEINEDHFEHIHQYRLHNETLDTSIKIESSKISLKLKELSETLQDIENEKRVQQEKASFLNEKITSIDEEVTLKLAPVNITLRERLNNLLEKEKELDQYNGLKNEYGTYSGYLSVLNEQLKVKTEQNDEAATLSSFAYSAFSTQVELILRSWNYPNLTTVSFNNSAKEFDIKINNVPRKSNGKGYRAITYSCFILAVMNYCIAQGRNHPRFVVIDSPLTPFKGNDRSLNLDETIDVNMESAFFQDLSNYRDDRQVIILENKDPNLNILDNINYIHFSGSEGMGRQGFIPKA